MVVNLEDLKIIADHLIHSIDGLMDKYTRFGSVLTLEDYVLTNIATDLRYRYNSLQIEEAFQDERIQMLLHFFTENEPSEQIH